MMTLNLDKKIEKSIKQIADDVSTIRKKLVHLEDVNQKLDHIVRNLREDYYYALGMKQFYDLYNYNGKKA